MASTPQAQPDGRARVMAVAKQLFAERGFPAVSMADIAAAAGLQKASLYYFYRSKEDIFMATMVEVIERTLKGIEAELTDANRLLTGDASSGRREMARLLAKFIRVGTKEGTVVRQIDIAFMKDNEDLRRLHVTVNKMRTAFLNFFVKHGVADPPMAFEVTVNAVRAYILNKRLGCGSCGSRVSPTRYASYLAGLLIR